MVAQSKRPALVVIGTGMAGAKVVETVLARDPDRIQIRMFGAEPTGTYNRMLLSSVLAGDADPSQLWLNPLEWYEERGVGVHVGIKAETIDRDRRVVIGKGGKVVEPYDRLLLATGSRPFVPPLEGMNQRGVFVFRTIEDCQTIGAYAQDCDRAIVLGGGLLGLEAARGLLNHGLEVTVVEMADSIMAQQLDATAAELLKRKLEAFGLRFVLGAKTARLLGDGAVRGVQLADGTAIDADMVVVSCGIRPNVDEARAAGLNVERGILVDDQLHSSDRNILAVGECAQHRGKLYGLVDPVYEQARVAGEVITGADASYAGSRLATTLKVMGVDLTSMGEVHAADAGHEVVSHLDPSQGIYKKLVFKGKVLAGAILLGASDVGGRLKRLFKEATPITGSALDCLLEGPDVAKNAADLLSLPDSEQICNCNEVSKETIVKAIRAGKCSISAIGLCTRAGTGCGTCQPLLQNLIDQCGSGNGQVAAKNKFELMKGEKDGLDALPDVLALAPGNRWQEATEADQQRAKWHGLFFRKTTPGHMMLRLRLNAGQTNARQFRVIADLSDEFGKGFADLTTRQQIQLRWFTLADVEEIWRRLAEAGLHSLQTGMDNVRGVCGCPVAGCTSHELFDATPVIQRFNALILGKKEYSNLPRKFNVTITGCMENCGHPETQDIGLTPAQRELDGQQVNGFNVLVGGKQGSGGYRPASPLDVFVIPEEASELCAEIVAIFRDHGSRASRTRARLAFLLDDKGVRWFRSELEKRWGRPLHKAGQDMRKPLHADHLGIHPQKRNIAIGQTPHYVGMLVPVGRITTAQMRGAADLAEGYSSGDIRVTVGQNLVIPNIPEDRIGALSDEPLFRELPYDPSPILRGLVCCTGNDYCGMALIDTKGYALDIARELERRTQGRRLKPLTMHWSGCPAGCGMHSVADIGLQGCRSRVNGQVVDAAHVSVSGKTGPKPVIATDLMYDVPIDQLADALEPLATYLPRQGS